MTHLDQRLIDGVPLATTQALGLTYFSPSKVGCHVLETAVKASHYRRQAYVPHTSDSVLDVSGSI